MSSQISSETGMKEYPKNMQKISLRKTSVKENGQKPQFQAVLCLPYKKDSTLEKPRYGAVFRRSKYGSASIRRRLVDMAWEQPLVLIKCVSYLPASCVEKLTGHPDTDVSVHAALHGTRDQCSRVLVLPESMTTLPPYSCGPA